MFLGTDISFESKNEYGHTEEGQWNEDGEPPKDINGTVALKALERVQAEVQTVQNQVDWLNPLILWASSQKIPKKTLDLIGNALEEAEKAKNEAVAAQEAEAQRTNDEIIAGAEAIESLTRWAFHPVQAVPTRPVGKVGKSSLRQAVNGLIDEKRNCWGEVWSPIKSAAADADFGDQLDESCQSVGVGSPLVPDSKTAEKFLASQLYDWSAFVEGPRIFIQTAKGIRALGAHIQKHGETFLWIHSREPTEYTLFKANIRKSIRLSKLLEGGRLGEILQEQDLSNDQKAFGQEISRDGLAISGTHVFLASKNARPDGPGLSGPCLFLSEGFCRGPIDLLSTRCSSRHPPLYG